VTLNADPRSPYLQVADAIRREITSGALVAGDRLPSVAELAEQHGVAKMTVQKALDVLRGEGLVIAWQGRGTFVREPGHGAEADPNDAAAITGRLDAVMDLIQQLEDRVAHLESQSKGAGGRRGR
jgi:DNA-binding GntR family transcriptional regulator